MSGALNFTAGGIAAASLGRSPNFAKYEIWYNPQNKLACYRNFASPFRRGVPAGGAAEGEQNPLSQKSSIFASSPKGRAKFVLQHTLLSVTAPQSAASRSRCGDTREHHPRCPTGPPVPLPRLPCRRPQNPHRWQSHRWPSYNPETSSG